MLQTITKQHFFLFCISDSVSPFAKREKYDNSKKPLGDSLAVELPALDRATLVRIQVSQPIY